MRRTFWLGWLFLSVLGWSQSPTPVGVQQNSVPSPQLSTAERVAIQAFEKQKGEGKRLYDEAQQGEGQVAKEWTAAHPGWHLDPATFKPTEDLHYQGTRGRPADVKPLTPEQHNSGGENTGKKPEVKK